MDEMIMKRAFEIMSYSDFIDGVAIVGDKMYEASFFDDELIITFPEDEYDPFEVGEYVTLKVITRNGDVFTVKGKVVGKTVTYGICHGDWCDIDKVVNIKIIR